MAFENRGAPGIVAGDDRLTEFGARPAKETWRRWPPPQPDRVDFVGHGERRQFIRRIVGNGEPQQEQQPLSNSSSAPVMRPDLVRWETGMNFGLIFGLDHAPG